MTERLAGDDRAVSTAVGYVLTLATTALLVSGLLIAAGGLVDDQRERAARTELGVYGQRIAAGVADADRLAATTDASGTARVRVPLPERAAGGGYAVVVRNVSASGDGPPYAYRIDLRSDAAGANVTVAVRTHAPLAEKRLSGGPLAVASRDADDGSTRELVLIPD